MDPNQNRYILGVFVAILAGIIIDLGIILQKKIINEHKDDEEYIKNLIRSKEWLLGITMQVAIGGGILYLIAILLIGPALVPGLMAAGLIILAIGSVKILNESLKTSEIIGIISLIIGILFLGLSSLQIDSNDVILVILDVGFNIRLFVYSFIFIGGFILQVRKMNAKIKLVIDRKDKVLLKRFLKGKTILKFCLIIFIFYIIS